MLPGQSVVPEQSSRRFIICFWVSKGEIVSVAICAHKGVEKTKMEYE